MMDGIFENGFVTAFPTDEYANEMPQDFETIAEAKAYISEMWNGHGVIESPFF